jgi:hypothetical protein
LLAVPVVIAVILEADRYSGKCAHFEAQIRRYQAVPFGEMLPVP